jgi:hypothetical protein
MVQFNAQHSNGMRLRITTSRCRFSGGADAATSSHIALGWPPKNRHGVHERPPQGRAMPVVHRLHSPQRARDAVAGRIEQLLSGEVVARLGCHAEGRTYVVPVTYAYDGNGLIIQSADGLKVRMMDQNPAACVEVDHIDDLANWRSVTAYF